MSYERTDRDAQKRSRMVRWGVLGLVLAGMTAIAYMHQHVYGAAKPAGVDALCPFGGVETLFSLVSGAGYIEKIAASAVVLLVGMLSLALVMRRSFCGQICPLGALQGIFGSLGDRLFRKRPEVPRGVDRVARYLKYVVLVFFTVWTWQAASLVMRPYDPWAAWAHISSPELFAEFGVGIAVLGISLAGSLVYERFFCKYLCPTGALLGLISKVSLFGIERDQNVCIDCGRCDTACPMNVAVSSSNSVTSSECISCNECVNACPAAGALEVKRAGGAVTKPAVASTIVVGVLAAIVAVSMAAGSFTWTMPSLAQAIEQGKGGAEAMGSPTTASGESFDTTVIKGYMSMQEISGATGIPAEEFTTRWGVPAQDLGQPMKEIKDQYGFSPDDVKVWVGERLSQ